MKKLSYRVLIVIIITGASCTTSKIDFKTAYKFSTYKNVETAYQSKSQEEKAVVADPLVSAQESYIPESVIEEDAVTDVSEINITLPSNREKAVEGRKELTKEKKKALRKELKKELRQIKREYKALTKGKKDVAATKASMTGKVWVGTVIGLAGLLIAILAGTSTIATIGWLGFLVGIVLVAWGLIEQGP